MTAYTAQQALQLRVPNAFSTSRVLLSVFLQPVAITRQNRSTLKSNAITSGSGYRPIEFRRYTEEDLRMFAEEDELTLELTQRFKDLLED